MSRPFLSHVITDDSALGGSVIERSLRFNNYSSSADDAELTRTVGTTSNRRTFTHSFWVKRTKLGYGMIFGHTDGIGGGSYFFNFVFSSDDEIEFNEYRYNESPSNKIRLITTRVFRDTTSWYHIVTAVDTTQGTSSNRVKIYVNGVQETDFDTEIYCDQNHDTYFNSTSPYPIMRIGLNGWGYGGANCYLAEFNAVDGYAYDPSYFGFTDSQTGLWMPKRYEGTYGTNGYRLDFSDNSSTAALGIDKSPNGNDFTVTNFSVSAGVGNDSVEDTPTNNFDTINPLQNGVPTILNGNLQYKNTTGTGQQSHSSFRVSSGKYYYEVTVSSSTNSSQYEYFGNNSAYVKTDGNIHPSGSTTVANGDVFGFYLNYDKKQITIYRNNSQIYQSGTDNALSPLPFLCGAFSNTVFSVNFGQQGFTYTPPAGAKKLSSKNLPPDVPSIIRPQKHFDTVLYTGNGSSNGDVQRISSLQFDPDFVWIKSRSASTTHHQVFDVIRSVGGDKALAPNLTNAEYSFSDFDFLNNGFNAPYSSSASYSCNTNSATYVAWCWKAGGAAVTNNDGSIASQVSANTEAGFSIVSFTGNQTSGATVGHGLNSKPKWILVKERGNANDWTVYHESLGYTGGGDTYVLFLNLNNDYGGGFAGGFNNTAPTTSVFSLGNSVETNRSGGSFIAYCWSEVPGYSKFGSYTGNGSSDGVFIHLGFRARWFMWKIASDDGGWGIIDTARDINNDDNEKQLGPDDQDPDGSYAVLDITSTGIKMRNSYNDTNQNNDTHVYMAFAEQPGTTAFETFPNAR